MTELAAGFDSRNPVSADIAVNAVPMPSYMPPRGMRSVGNTVRPVLGSSKFFMRLDQAE